MTLAELEPFLRKGLANGSIWVDDEAAQGELTVCLANEMAGEIERRGDVPETLLVCYADSTLEGSRFAQVEPLPARATDFYLSLPKRMHGHAGAVSAQLLPCGRECLAVGLGKNGTVTLGAY